ncbi:MAG: hypothetical protein RR984_00675 [Bacilli bacterium]
MGEISQFIFNIVFSCLSIGIPVFVTIYTVNKRIKTQTRENHQPHVVLDFIESIDMLDEYKFHYSLLGEKYKYLYNENEINIKNFASLKITLKNIGYGVASNLKFYDISNGNQILGQQKSSNNLNQKLYTTIDIASNENKNVYFKVLSEIFDRSSRIENECFRLLCVYKDLNNNIDSFIITIVLKSKKYYDFFAYQPGSTSYINIQSDNSKIFKKIYSVYSNL